ncbi:MAG: uroporphyrinogen-III C-methyltransferase [Burkholderiales bacterium]|nr:uroporphyrinogen-III C-methyltransferase [Burkholderiales bacterium]MDQ3196105.1 uroporphyrinogen-III C-methyltransferase [Pseudomonadota bacterium]
MEQADPALVSPDASQTAAPEATPPPIAASVSPPPDPKPGNHVAKALSLLALLVSLGALALAVWLWFDGRNQANVLTQELSRRLAQSDSASTEARLIADQSRESARSAETKLGLIESKLAESQNQQVALEALYQELSRNRDDWTLAEVEQILLIASQQLQLAGNVKAALLALQAADSRLQRMDQPHLAPLRKVIDRDIENLKAAPYPDVVGISVRLDNLAAAVDGLPLAQEARLPESSQAGGNDAPTRGIENVQNRVMQVLRGAWNEFKQLVRIERVDQPLPPLLSPNEAFFLRENLRLRLLSARLALLARDEVSFEADLKAASGWLTRYFDPGDKAVSNALAGIAQLLEADIAIELPAISESLEAVRNYTLARDPAQ